MSVAPPTDLAAQARDAPRRGLRLAGHPLHPAATHLPLGAMLLVPLWDLAAWLGGPPTLWPAAWWCLLAGVAGGMVAASLGLVDFAALPARDRVLSLANRHIALVGAALSLDLGSLLLRTPDAAPTLEAGLLSTVAAVLLVAGAWHGAELVYGHGVGTRVAPPEASGPVPVRRPDPQPLQQSTPSI